MSEEYGEKTEAPTPRRRQEAREQGQVARSQDLMKALRARLAETLSLRSNDPAAAFAQSLASLAHVARALAPVLIGVVLVVVVANLLQVGFAPSLKRIQPNLGALNPLKGLG